MAGFREFVTGEVLTAANVNLFLMEQAVMTFADGTARDAALSGVLREGLLVYNLATSELQKYDGSAWVSAAPAPPAPPAGIGSNVVQVIKTNAFTTTSTSFANVTGLAATITPTTDTSKILILIDAKISNTDADAGGQSTALDITGGNAATYIGGASSSQRRAFAGGLSIDIFPSARYNMQAVAMYLDSPASASATTYQVRMAVSSGTGTLNRYGSESTDTRGVRPASSITLIEVAP